MTLESLSGHMLETLDRVCEDFETAWRCGIRPRIEDFLRPWSEPIRGELLRLLLEMELELRQGVGEQPGIQEYLKRFEEYSDLIVTVFESKSGDLTGKDESRTTTHHGSEVTTGALHESTESKPGDLGVRSHAPGRIEPADESPIPERIGRFRPIRLLGKGNFRVYLALDEDGTEVAVKVARPDDSLARKRLMSLKAEAQRMSGLDHPHIVKLREFVEYPDGDGKVGTEPDGFIVLEFVDGSTLEELFRSERPDPVRLAEILATVAEAVGHAHQARLVHRDLKPSNILIDRHGEAYVCDFGLAVDEEIQLLRRGEVAGTLPYMAPEQVRGETNRLDGRTDIWAIGVILYRGLTGRLPFRGETHAVCFEEILQREPRPPRQYDDRIPRELERICLRCLSRPMTERYLTAFDLAEDLRNWLDREHQVSKAVLGLPVLPRGLRAFGEEDAGVFLSLLPGQRGGDGLPESIRFWKMRLEALRGDKAFPVGLIFGPSGSGKSSFVRAGLLPNVDPGLVRALYVEATRSGTESRILSELRQEIPTLPADLDLPDALALLREKVKLRPRQKIVIIVDQIEQWLQSGKIDAESPLVRALRQCDGRGVQALLLVRDDFWMAVSQLFRLLEIPIVDQVNATSLQLFETDHARKVLEEFGQSLGQVPAGPVAGSPQSLFLDQAASSLSGPDGRVVPIRLSLFAEVVRHRPWTIDTLDQLGGAEGIEVKFLEQAFESPASQPSYRLHRQAAQKVLKALLPPPTSQIRGAARPRSFLLEASGHGGQPDRFGDLMHMLDQEMRLVVAIEPDGEQAGGAETGYPDGPPDEVQYQFAHDYLIRPVRQWLEKEQGSTRRGRARLRLQLITASWLERPDRRHLPSILESLSILRNVPPSEWSPDERRLMAAAGGHLLKRGLAAAALLGALVLLGREIRDRNQATTKLEQVFLVQDRDIPKLVAELDPHKDRVLDELKVRERDPSRPQEKREIASLLLYQFEPTSDRGLRLRDCLLTDADPERVDLIRKTMAIHPAHAGAESLEKKVTDRKAEPFEELRASAALAALEPSSVKKWADPVRLTSALLMEERKTLPRWLDLLGPALPLLVAPLEEVSRDREREPMSRTNAAEALADALVRQGDSETLARAIVASHQTEAALILTRALTRLGRPQPALVYLHSVLEERPANARDEQAVDTMASRQATAAIVLAAIGDSESLWPLLRHQTDPRRRSMLIEKLSRSVTTRPLLLTRLERPALDPVERQALIMVWAETVKSELAPGMEASVIRAARALFQDDSDPGVHSASELLLRRWNLAAVLSQAEEELRRLPARPAARLWEFGPNGHILVILRGPLSFRMGSRDHEDRRFPEREQIHDRSIDRSLAVSTKEVTVEQFRTFKREASKQDYVPEPRFIREPGCAVNSPDWFEAARYCNWLSKLAGIDEAQWCYPKDFKLGFTLGLDSLGKTGYRLPTEAEWEYMARAGTETSRYYGETDDLFPRYGWTFLNSGDLVHPVGGLLPNEFGLFDMLGNVWEWCHDGPVLKTNEEYPAYPITVPGQPASDRPRPSVMDRKTGRMLRGGCFCYSPGMARAANRYLVTAEYIEGTFGFRVVRTIATQSKK